MRVQKLPFSSHTHTSHNCTYTYHALCTIIHNMYKNIGKHDPLPLTPVPLLSPARSLSSISLPHPLDQYGSFFSSLGGYKAIVLGGDVWRTAIDWVVEFKMLSIGQFGVFLVLQYMPTWVFCKDFVDWYYHINKINIYNSIEYIVLWIWNKIQCMLCTITTNNYVFDKKLKTQCFSPTFEIQESRGPLGDQEVHSTFKSFLFIPICVY